MGRFFNLENPFFQGLSKIVDCAYLSLVWILFSLPLVTIGASTTALYYTANKVIRHERGYVFREFWKCFKTSFKQSTIVWLASAVLIWLLYSDIKIMNYLMPEGNVQTIAKTFFYAMIFVIIMVVLYIFPYIARFEAPLKVIVKNSAFIAIRHLPWTVLDALLVAVCIFLIWLIPISIIILPTVGGIVASLMLERIFKRYMSKEDREKEEKLNSKEFL